MTVYEVIDKEVRELAWHKEPCMIGVGAFSPIGLRGIFEWRYWFDL